MKFVNIHGQEVDLGAAARSAPKRKPSSSLADSYHKGWLALGYSPDQMAEGRRRYDEDSARLAAAGRPQPEWSEQWFFRHNKPLRIRHKPYEVRSAAEAAVALAERAGWRGCRVEALARGS